MILSLAAALAALTVQSTDPLAPARAGKHLCVNADAAAKTCNAISVYTFGADGSIVSENRAAISPAPMVVLTTRTPVTMRGDQECSSTAGFADQITSVEIDGQPLAGDQLAGARQMIATQLQAALGEGELCSTYAPAADGKVDYTVTLNGAARPELNGSALWIGADAGWRVAI